MVLGWAGNINGKEAYSVPTEHFTQANEVQELLGRLRSTCEGKQFSDVIDDQGSQYVDLVMEGGGVLGVALVGYTFVLEEMGLRFLRVGGTSAGSINALLVAGLGTPQRRKSEKLVKELANVDFWSFVDGGRAARAFVQTLVRHPSLPGLGFRSLWVLRTVFKQLGLNPGEAFYGWLSGLLSSDGVRTTRDLRERMMTMPAGLRTRDGKPFTPDPKKWPLALVAADVSSQT